MLLKIEPIRLVLEDTSWPRENKKLKIRNIVRAIVYTDDGFFYFVNPTRDDDFGKLNFIETSGGGVDDFETLKTAIKRELKEEMGVEIALVAYLGFVKDYYNLINRENHNHYFLVKALSFGNKHLTPEESFEFDLKTFKTTYQEARKFYNKNKETKLGRLIYAREVPILDYAFETINKYHLANLK